MIDPELAILFAIGGTAIGVAATFSINALRGKTASKTSQQLLEQAKAEAARVLQEAELSGKLEITRQRAALEAELARQRDEVNERERRMDRREDTLGHREEALDKRDQALDSREQRLNDREKSIEGRMGEAKALIDAQKQRLADVSGMGVEQARAMLLERVRDDLARDEAELLARQTERLKEQAEDKAKWVISQAIHRVASEHTAENTTVSIALPSEEMKGRIIGRDGRNIRAFEKACGVDVVIDDTPGVVLVSSFDSIRREIARQSLQKLVQDGRIHPARIEEIVEATNKDLEKIIAERGKQAQFDADVYQIHPKLQYLLGRLYFRSSYGQNVLLHSIEVAHILGMMAGEMGLDVKLGKRCGLLHDIGKALDQEAEGGHPDIGMDTAKKYKEPAEVVESIGFHHRTHEAKTVWPILTAAADAISASRPGARLEKIERHLERNKKLEELATRYPGVESAYAIQAGRELRVIVNEHKVPEDKVEHLARQIAKDIEADLTYPGEIRVTLIRERRVVEYAR